MRGAGRIGMATSVVAMCLAASTSCRPMGKSGSKGINYDSSGREEASQRRDAFKTKFVAELKTIVARNDACPTLPWRVPWIELRQAKAVGGLLDRGPRMDVVVPKPGPDGRFPASPKDAGANVMVAGVMDARPGSWFSGSGGYFVIRMELTGPGGQRAVAGFARFPKATVGEALKLGYESPPEVEIYACDAVESQLEKETKPTVEPILVFRVNEINAKRQMDVRARTHAMKDAFAPKCDRAPLLQFRFGPACDEFPIGTFFALPAVLREKVRGVPADDDVYVLNAGSKVSSVIAVPQNRKSLVIFDQEKSGGDGSDRAPSGPPLDLWFPYFLRFEKHVEEFNVAAREGFGGIAGEVAGLVPGGSVVAKAVELSLDGVLDAVFSPQK